MASMKFMVHLLRFNVFQWRQNRDLQLISETNNNDPSYQF